MTSEIRTNSITSRAGMSTVTMTDSGPMFSGITTFVDNSGFTFGVGGGTSIFTPATNVLTFGTNNTEKIRIDANGNANISGITTASNFKTGSSNLHSTGLTVGNALVHSTGINVGTGATVHSPTSNVLTLGTNNNERVRVDSSGRLLVGSYAAANPKSSGAGSIDLDNQAFTIIVGGNHPSGGRSDNTAKTFRMSMVHNTLAEEPINILQGYCDSSDNNLYIGGGTGSANSLTQVRVYTGTNTTTTGGTERIRVNNAGAIGLSGANYGSSGQVLTSQGSGSAVTWSTVSGTTINNNANDRIITGSGTANTLEGESTLTFNGTQLRVNAGAGSNVQADGAGSYGQFSGVRVWMGLNSRNHNTAVGNGALGSATGGDDCTAVGHNAYQNGTSGTDNTAIGSHCMVGTVTGNRNCGLGHGALNKLTSGYDNTGLGRLAGLEMLGGYYNTYVGSSAGEKTIGANNNTFLGFKAGIDITTGNQNVAVGSYAFNKQTETSNNTAVGTYSQAYSSTNSAGNNTSLGHEALRGASNSSPLTGGRNVAIGRGCMEDCRSGYRNTAIGWESLRNISTGYEHVCLGYEAGRTITTGHGNILIGASAAPSSNTVSREMFIGNGTAGNGSNTFYVHSTSGAYNGTNNQHWNQTSDQRIKKNITNFDTGLEVINQLQVRNFEYKTKDEIKSTNPELTDVLQSMENVLNISGVQKGLIAQEAEAVSSALVTTPSTGVKALVPDEIFWYMLNSIKELSTKVDKLEQDNIALRARVTNLEGN